MKEAVLVVALIFSCAMAIVAGSVTMASRLNHLPAKPQTESIYEIEWCLGVDSSGRPAIRRFHADSVAWGQYWIWFIDKDTGKQTQLSSHGVAVYSSPTAFEGVLEKE